MQPRHRILIVDDDAGPRESLNMILKPFYIIYLASNGEEALAMVKQYPIDLVVLDLKMPGLQGTDILKEIKRQHSDIEIIVLTGYGSLKSAVESIRYGAADYLLKPFNVAEIISVINKTLHKKKVYDDLKGFLKELGQAVGMDADPTTVKQDLKEHHDLLQRVKTLVTKPLADGTGSPNVRCLDFVKVLTDTLDKKDPYTYGHSSRVNYYANLIAQKLDLSQSELDNLQIGAFLHDIGKVGIENKIITKEGKFDDKELKIARRHPEIGTELVGPIGLPHQVTSVIRHHHEFYDGTGYPDGLKGEAIPLLARIVSLAEVFDAMVSNRPYRKALPLDEAIKEIKRCSGTQFDPKLVDILLRLVEEKGENLLPEHLYPAPGMVEA
jgi:putative nucleotidyltransferase with HDIG domain